MAPCLTVNYYSILNLIFFTFILLIKANDDYYTSPFGIQKLVKVEQKLLRAAFEYANALENRLNIIKSYFGDYGESVVEGMQIPGQKLSTTSTTSTTTTSEKKSTNDDNNNNLKGYFSTEEMDVVANQVSSHPLMTYRLIRRFALELQEIQLDINKNIEKKFLTEIEKLRKGMTFPNVKDISGAIEGIIRVQDAYDLDVTEFSSGNFMGLETKSRLRAVDCYQIGIYAFKATVFTRSIEWLERAFNIIKLENDTSISLDMVENALRQAIQMHNNVLQNEPKNMYVYQQPFEMISPSNNGNGSESNQKKNIKLKRKLEEMGHELYRKTDSLMDMWNFAALCAGKVLQPMKVTKSLKCFYRSTWPLIPFYSEKIEFLHNNPPVYQIYDVLSDAVIERILEQSAPFMLRAKVVDTTGGDLFVQSSVRTSTTHWIIENKDLVLVNIPKRIQLITGLDLTTDSLAAEDLQVSSYGIGGHYNPHFDTLFDKQPKGSISPFETFMGDRIATFMLYLSTVERGGNTAFPRLSVESIRHCYLLGIVTQPIKGSAVFWYNLKNDGSHEPLSLHGGCPVIYGIKHVANKWIRSNAQMFRHKCSSTIRK